MKKIPKEEQERILKAERHCANWACEKKFKQEKNHKRACRFHTGRWDFGHSGVRIASNASDPVLWKAHWTCCMKDWDEPGCTYGPHQGPIGGSKRKYLWPDIRAQMFFRRKVPAKWQEKLAQEAEKDSMNFNLRIKELKNQFGYGGVSAA